MRVGGKDSWIKIKDARVTAVIKKKSRRKIRPADQSVFFKTQWP